MMKNKSDYKRKYEQKYANETRYPTVETLDDKLFRVEKTQEAEGNSPFMGEMTLLLSILVLGITVVFNFINLKFSVGAYEGAEKVLEDNTIIASCSLLVLIIILVLMLLRYAARFIDLKLRLPSAGIREIEIDCIKEEMKKREKEEELQMIKEEYNSIEEELCEKEKIIRKNEAKIKEKEDAKVDINASISIAVSAILGFGLSYIIPSSEDSIILLSEKLTQLFLYLFICVVIVLIVVFATRILTKLFINIFDKNQLENLLKDTEKLYNDKFALEKKLRENNKKN
jgi:hypothetical protein